VRRPVRIFVLAAGRRVPAGTCFPAEALGNASLVAPGRHGASGRPYRPLPTAFAEKVPGGSGFAQVGARQVRWRARFRVRLWGVARDGARHRCRRGRLVCAIWLRTWCGRIWRLSPRCRRCFAANPARALPTIPSHETERGARPRAQPPCWAPARPERSRPASPETAGLASRRSESRRFHIGNPVAAPGDPRRRGRKIGAYGPSPAPRTTDNRSRPADTSAAKPGRRENLRRCRCPRHSRLFAIGIAQGLCGSARQARPRGSGPGGPADLQAHGHHGPKSKTFFNDVPGAPFAGRCFIWVICRSSGAFDGSPKLAAEPAGRHCWCPTRNADPTIISGPPMPAGPSPMGGGAGLGESRQSNV